MDARNGDDNITGSKGPDTIRGGSGDDTLLGDEGNDVLQGGDGNDTLNGGNGNDLLLGYDCFGPNADCSVVHNNGSDNDILNGDEGNDCLDGGSGDDTETGGAGSDAFVLWGDPDNDTITDFTPGTYDPQNPGDVDVIVDLTGSAQVKWVKGSKKDSTPSVCVIATSGNNNIILSGVEGDGPNGGCTSYKVKILQPLTDTLPTQCTGHPYTFQ